MTYMSPVSASLLSTSENGKFPVSRLPCFCFLFPKIGNRDGSFPKTKKMKRKKEMKNGREGYMKGGRKELSGEGQP